MSSPDSEPNPNVADVSQLQGLLLTGEGLTSMTPDRLAMLGEMMGGLGLQITVVHDLGWLPELAEREPEPVPASRQDFRNFAEAHSYSDARARKAWRAVLNLPHRAEWQRRTDGTDDPYPMPRFLREEEDDYKLAIVDMRSLYDRFIASNMSTSAWYQPGSVPFLLDITNEFVRPDTPLRLEPSPRKQDNPAG